MHAGLGGRHNLRGSQREYWPTHAARQTQQYNVKAGRQATWTFESVTFDLGRDKTARPGRAGATEGCRRHRRCSR